MDFLRKYGEAATIPFILFEIDGVDFRVDAAHASGDTVVMKDEGAEATTTNGFTDEGSGYSLVLTATEMEAARIVVYLIDQTATKVWLDKTIVIETYGHASAQHAFDLDTASVAQTGDSYSVVSGLNDLSSTDIEVAVWNEATADRTVAGSFGLKVGSIGTADDMADAVWDEARSGHVTGGTFGENVLADTVAISGDSTAADNMESTYDGTGYTDDFAPSQQQQLNNLAIGSAAISTTASTAVITTGSETNSYTSTHARDAIYHQMTDVAGTIDLYYEFSVGGNGIPVSFTMYGYSNGTNDPIKVFGYNWSGTAWEQIGTIAGVVGTTPAEHTFSMYTTHVGTGADIGKVRIRLQNTGLTTANWYMDQLYISYTISTQSVGYANGAIWVDTNNGTAGTTAYVNGTADNPVLTWADAGTLSGTLGLTSFEIVNGSSITLTGGIANYTMHGQNWSLALASQTIAGASIQGAVVSGVGLNGGDKPIFDNCEFGTVSLPGVTAHECVLTETITITEASDYFIDTCYSGVAGTNTPILDFGASIGNTNVNFRHYSGGIELQNMGQAGTDNMSLEGWGQYILNANCVGGTLAPRGHFKKTDNSRLVIISEDANFKTSVITTGIAQASTVNTVTLATTASSTDGAYDPAMVIIVAGTGIGQSRLIYEYTGATRVAVVDRNWKVNPDTTSEYRIVAHAGREHVNEGLAQAGTNNTITLNALASSDDSAYSNQVVFIRSGTGEDQVRLVTGYVGSTKVATVESVWGTNPDATSGYAMLPLHVHTTEETTSSVWDVAMASHDVEDSFGNVLNDLTEESSDVYRFNANALTEAPTGGGTSSEIADAVWDEVASGHVTGGSFGEEVQSHSTSSELSTHDAKLDTVDTNVDSILVDTGTTIPAQISGLNDVSTAEVNAECDQALQDYDPPTKTEMDTGFAGLNDPTAAENATALLTTTLTEPATGLVDKTVSAFFWHLYSRFYNLVTQTSTQQRVFKDDSVTALGTMATSDDGVTQTKGKAS